MNDQLRIEGIEPGSAGKIKNIRTILETITDPEIPALSITDLGIVRDIKIIAEPGTPGDIIEIAITPTYSGCPAMDVIRTQIRLTLAEHGYTNVKIHNVLSPAWTTDWMTESGKEKLAAYGIAPPAYNVSSCSAMEMNEQLAVQCPHCKSYHTEMISRFGSTACKALYKCNDCKEPFDYFKCH